MGYCTHCGYNLREHQVGSGREVTSIARAPLPGPVLGISALVAVLLLPVVWIAGGRSGALYALCGAAAGILLLGPVAIGQARRSGRPWHVSSIFLCAAGATIPFVTLCLYVAVFIIGRSSNVAQMADHSGFDYWGLWMDAWPLMLLGNPVCAIIGMIAIAKPPYDRRYVVSWALPIAVVIAALAAASIAVVHFPDA